MNSSWALPNVEAFHSRFGVEDVAVAVCAAVAAWQLVKGILTEWTFAVWIVFRLAKVCESMNMDVSKNRGKKPKMDGEYNGTPFLWMIWG